ncbi:hypothetical protein EJ08DRAFT_694824 [Tothia fuscella]|uniref:Phytocyanin domain-containing protein n=1 Tax=Tothia fuscella TaxID=1048955 RepID=A0A9P4NX04_9PEZI|nr:hypothetical protein EJ08DRAFT_694824 [Tothia fuscella]
MVQLTHIAPVAALFSGAFAATIKVQAGPGNSFRPESVTAATGDIVEFHFSRTHNVASSSFDSPCSSSGDSAIFSGDLSSGVFSVKVNSTDPIWYFCGYSNHCQDGMVGVINPSGGTLNDYKSRSQATSSSNMPSGVQNGIQGDASAFGSSSGSSASSSASAVSSSAAASGSSASSAAASTAGTATGSSTSGSATSSTSPNAAAPVKAFGLTGVIGALVAFLA